MIPAVLKKPRLQIFLAVLLLTLYLFWRAREALTPFVLGLVVAYLMLPLVHFFQRRMPDFLKKRHLARPFAILSVYLVAALISVAAIFTIIPPIISQITSLYGNIDKIYTQGAELVNEGLAQYQQIPLEIRQQIETQLGDFSPTTVLSPVFTTVQGAVNTITNTISFLISLLIIPFWLFFILNDENSVLQRAIGVIPRDLRADVEAIRIIIDRILGAYIRGQLIAATILGVVVTIGLMVLRVQYALLLGVFAALIALIPFLGAILGAVPATIVAFVQEPQLALAVIILFTVYQQIDNIFISPRIIGEAVALHPALIMVVIVIGSSLLGPLGALIAVPATAILRDVSQYFYIRAGENAPGPEEALQQVGYDVPPTLKAMIRVTPAPAIGD